MNIAEQLTAEMERLLPGSQTIRIVDKSGRQFPELCRTSDAWAHYTVSALDSDERVGFAITVPMYDEAITTISIEKAGCNPRQIEQTHEALRHLIPRIINRWYRSALRHVRTANEALLSSLAPAELARNVVRHALAVLPEGDAGVFRIYDEDSDMLVAITQIGFGNDYLSHRYQRNESISGIVFETQTPIILRSHSEIRHAQRNLRPENMAHFERSAIAQSLICVPVRIGDKRLGTLTLLNFREEAAFSRFGLDIMDLFASHLAIAWKNARAHDVALRNLETQQELRKQLGARNLELSSAISIYNDILAAFASTGDLAAKLQATTNKFGLHFRYRDIFGNRFPSSGPGDAETLSDRQPEHHFPILISNVEVGHISISDEYFSAIDRIRTEILTSFIALEIRKDVTSQDVQNRKKSRLFYDLASAPNADLLTDLARYKFTPKRYSQIYVIQYPDIAADEDASIFFQRTLSRLNRTLNFANSFLFYDEGDIVVWLSADTPNALHRASERMTALAPSDSAYCGISAEFEASALLRLHYRNALESAQILAMKGRFGAQHYDKIGIEKLLIHQDRARIVDFVDSVIGKIRNTAHDTLYRTLDTYIKSGKSVSETAKMLRIHNNTVYQRLEKVRDLTGYDVSNADDFVLLSIACHLRQIFA